MAEQSVESTCALRVMSELLMCGCRRHEVTEHYTGQIHQGALSDFGDYMEVLWKIGENSMFFNSYLLHFYVVSEAIGMLGNISVEIVQDVIIFPMIC